MSDQYPPELSSILLARKGMAGADGFSPNEIDPSRPVWPRRRTTLVAALMAAVAALGGTATWLTTQDRGSAVSSTPLPVPPAVRPERIAAAVPEPTGNLVQNPRVAVGNPAAGAEATQPSTIPGPPPVAAEGPGVPAQTSRSEVGTTPPQSAALVPGTKVEKPRTPTPSGHLVVKPRPEAPAQTYRIQLHTLQSREAVEREWTKLQRRHGDLLADKQLVINQLDVAGTESRYRMQLGNLPTKTAARQLCRALEGRGHKCILVPTT